jgi:hypothetical protein
VSVFLKTSVFGFGVGYRPSSSLYIAAKYIKFNTFVALYVTFVALDVLCL